MLKWCKYTYHVAQVTPLVQEVPVHVDAVGLGKVL